MPNCLKNTSIKVIYIASTYTSNTYTRNICVGNNFFAINVQMKNTGTENIYLNSINKKSANIRGTSTIKHLKINF